MMYLKKCCWFFSSAHLFDAFVFGYAHKARIKKFIHSQKPVFDDFTPSRSHLISS